MLHEFTAEITEASEGRFIARIAPFGVPVAYGRTTVEFAAGSIQVPTSPVALTLDHADGVLDRIGVMSRSFDTAEGMFAEFTLADTTAGRDVHELLKMGAVTDVSVGVELAEEFTGGVMSGTLDHVSLVDRGRFPSAEVLSVHDEKEPTMAETEEATAPVVAYDDTGIKTALAEMSDKIDTFETKVVEEPALFSSMGDYVKALVVDDDRIAKHALATDDTTGAAGVVPDYLSSEYISIIADGRPFVGSLPSDPIGNAGMSVVYPKHTSGPSVALQASEHVEVSSTALVIGTQTVALNTYAGANQVSKQLIERSAPSFVDILFRELAGQYAQVTDAASIATAVAGAGDTAVLADLSTDAAATFAAFALASSTIASGVRKPAGDVYLASDRWAQLNSLADTDGRPILTYGANGPMNAAGQSSFATDVAQYHGWVVRLVPDAAAGTCLIANKGFMANLESSPTQLSATQVSTLAVDFGIWGLQNIVVKQADALYTLTAV